jgi:hypothetical protein
MSLALLRELGLKPNPVAGCTRPFQRLNAARAAVESRQNATIASSSGSMRLGFVPAGMHFIPTHNCDPFYPRCRRMPR